jgi:hypothetical protein
MQRGVLILNQNELKELTKYVELKKLDIALENISEVNKIFVNEEELETILDQIGIVTDNEVLSSARSKVSQLLLSFR